MRAGRGRGEARERSHARVIILRTVSAAFHEIDAVYQVIGRDLFGSEDLRRDLAKRDPDEAAFFALIAAGAEIDNGGFSQFFTSSTGELIGDAIAGADRFGLADHAQLLRDASDALFPEGVPLDHEARLQEWDQMCDPDDDDFDERISALDERWYALDDVLEQRLHAYAKTYRPS